MKQKRNDVSIRDQLLAEIKAKKAATVKDLVTKRRPRKVVYNALYRLMSSGDVVKRTEEGVTKYMPAKKEKESARPYRIEKSSTPIPTTRAVDTVIEAVSKVAADNAMMRALLAEFVEKAQEILSNGRSD